jgi:ribonuclease E
MSFAPESEALADPKALLRVPVGLASPLWPLFAGVAMGGATWWWMTRWARPANLEAMFGATVEAEAETASEMIAVAQPVVDAAESVVETAAAPVIETLAELEPVLEAVAESVVEPVAEPELEAAVTEPVLEALAEAPAALEPVGGEAAPISPALEAAPLETVEAAPLETAEAAPLEIVEAAPKPRKKPAPPKAD